MPNYAVKDALGLTPKQRAAIEALLTTKGIGAAADKAGVSRESIQLWLKDDEFRAALREATGEVFGEVSRGLLQLSVKAVTSYEELLDNPTDPGGVVKRAAANDVVSHAIKLWEMLSVDERLALMELRLSA